MSIVRRIKGRVFKANRRESGVAGVARMSPEWSRAELRGAYLEGTNQGPYMGVPTQ
jgi:hypothetical protein